MKYKIMRMFRDRNEIFIDLYNKEFGSNIELKFCCYGCANKYETLLNWLQYCMSERVDVEPSNIINQYEIITISDKLRKCEVE